MTGRGRCISFIQIDGNIISGFEYECDDMRLRHCTVMFTLKYKIRFIKLISNNFVLEIVT